MHNMKVVLYGMGSWVDNHYLWLKRNFSIVGTYDRDAGKKEKAKEMGFSFYTLEELKEERYEAVLITSTYEEEITKYLQNELNIQAKIFSGNALYREWEEKYYNGNLNSFGENYPDKIFAMIQRGDTTSVSGLFALFGCFVREISNAIKKGQIPVVDMKNFYTIYHENWNQVGSVNAYEYFFKQPYEEYSVEDALKAANVTYANKFLDTNEQEERLIKNVVYDRKLRQEYHEIYQNYMQLSLNINQEYQKKRKEILEPHIVAGEKILAVSIRGTDYIVQKPYLHNIQPTLEQVADKIREAFRDWGITKVYVNSDEEKSICYMKKAFPGKVFSMDYQRFDSYYDSQGGLIGNMQFERENDAYRKGADYLISTLLATECSCYIAGLNSGSLATLVMSNGFEQEYIFDNLGMYGIDDDAYIYTPDGRPIYINK